MLFSVAVMGLQMTLPDFGPFSLAKTEQLFVREGLLAEHMAVRLLQCVMGCGASYSSISLCFRPVIHTR